jgi:hypothetical protein
MFQEAINAVFMADNKRRYQRPHTVHWPSEASVILNGSMVGTCMREKYLQRMGYPADKDTPIENIRKMKAGKAIEQYEIEGGKAAGLWLADDVGFQFTSDNITVSGKLDAIYRGSGDERICVEYKSSSGWNFIKTVFGGTGPNAYKWAKPKMEHALQTMLYLHALSDLSYGIIFYINRDNMQTIEHKIELIDGFLYINGDRYNISIDMIVNRYKKLTEHLESSIMPPRDYVPEYKAKDIDELHSRKIVTKWEYDRWNNEGILPGEMRCSWCQWAPTCKSIVTEGDNDSDESNMDEEDVEVDDVDSAPLVVF